MSGESTVSAMERSKEIVGQGARLARHGVSVSGRGLTDQAIAAVGQIPIRDRAELREQYPGQTPDEVADALVRTAARASAALGAAFGAWAVLPLVPMMPAEVAAETLAVVCVEVKLVAELHELYGLAVTGSPAHRVAAYLAAWADQRSAVLLPGGLALAVGSPLRKRLSRRLAHRTGRSALSLAPLFTGSALAATFNRRETRRVGKTVRAALVKDPLARRDWGGD